MGRRLTPEEKVLRDQRAPLVGAVVAYGSKVDGYRIGRVEAVDVELDEPEDPRVVLTLYNANSPTRWLAYWEPLNFAQTIVPALSME